MDITPFYANKDEKPLDRILESGGFCSIFRTIACIGDSLSSGSFEWINKAGEISFYDHFEYSWGQYLSRMTGSKVYNFSRGGMTAEEYYTSFADGKDLWSEDKLCQAYIMALGVNDIIFQDKPLGSVDDIDLSDYNRNANTFAGYYARILQRIRSMQPKSKFFLVTMPLEDIEKRDELTRKHRELLFQIAEKFESVYIIDLTEYAPVYDTEFKRNFFTGGHMTPTGYQLTARMISSYIDYIIRNNPEEFNKVGIMGVED